MVRLVSPARWAVALAACLLSFSCGGDDEGAPTDDDGNTGPSTGSTCPSQQTLTYENFGMAFFETYCTRCHSSTLSGSARNGAPVGYNWDDLDVVREHAQLIDKMAAAGPKAVNTTMPPGNVPRPMVEEREKLGEWLECGAP